MKSALKTERNTAHKQFIRDYLKMVKTHPSADIVYRDVKKRLPNISQATVYRVLSGLKEKGEIISIETKNVTFYDGDTSDHAHFICTECNKVYDIFDVCSSCTILKNKRIKVGKVKNFIIQFFGTCNSCKPKN
jgi:Fe2+ or Zn2+ uptake regulation protein